MVLHYFSVWIPLLPPYLQGSVLQTHYMHNLQNIIFEPFAVHAMPGLPATQQLAALPITSSAAVGTGTPGGSTHGRDAAMVQ